MKLWGFYCERCGIHSGDAVLTESPNDYAPSCCGGKPMTPYEIPKKEGKSEQDV